jgi:Uma2 family endonuclease
MMTDLLPVAKPRRTLAKPRWVSIPEYFRAEEKSLYKNEYHNGIVKKMAGASLTHNLLAQKISAMIDRFLEDEAYPYMVSNSDTKIRIEDFDKIVYPDAVVICEKPDYYLGRKDTITNPLLIVEVLSKSTEGFDRSLKFDYYRTLPSFKEYVLVEQDHKRVSVFTKQDDTTWIIKDYLGDDAIAILHALHDCPLPLKRLYRGLEL